MLRLDSSEMLPGSQKGENRGLRLDSAILTPATGACNVGTGNNHVTPHDVNSPASLIDM